MGDWNEDIASDLRCIIYLLRSKCVFRVGGDREPIIYCAIIDQLKNLDINNATIKAILDEYYNLPSDYYIEDDGSEVDEEIVEFFSDKSIEEWLDSNKDKFKKRR